MSAKVARADSKLDRITGAIGVSECGKDWLKIALDPFHDTQVAHLEGVPDLSDSPSVVQCIKQTMTCSVPPNLTTGQTWDLHLVDLPWDNLQNMSNCSIGSSTAIPFTGSNDPVNFNIAGVPSTVAARAIGGLTAMAVLTGNSTNISLVQNNTGTPGSYYKSLTIPSAYTNGNYRKIASGFEGISVGPALYKSGTVYCYRQAVPTNDNSSDWSVNSYNATTGANVYSTRVDVLPFSGPPTNIADADLLPGTRSWEAMKGAYVVSRFNTSKAPRFSNNFAQPLMIDSYTSNNTSLYHTVSTPTSITYGGGTTPPTAYVYDSCVWNNQDMSGIYFSGLNAQDVITVNYNVYIERFPTISDLNLIVLATPSPQMDDAAMSLYSAISREMPVGVPQEENGLGDWFSGIVNTISSVVSPIARMIPHPLAQAIAGVSDIAGGLTRREERRAENNSIPMAPPMTFQQEVEAHRMSQLRYNRPFTGVSVPQAPAIGSLTLPNSYKNGIHRFNSIRDQAFKAQGKRLGLQTTNFKLNAKRYAALQGKHNKNQILSQNHNKPAQKEKRLERKVAKIIRSKIPRAPPLSKKQKQQLSSARAKSFNRAGAKQFGKKFLRNFEI